MPDTEKKFQLLADQFAALEKSLTAAQSAEQRAQLLKRMNAVIVIEELDQFILLNQSSLDAKLASIDTNSGPHRARSADART